MGQTDRSWYLIGCKLCLEPRRISKLLSPVGTPLRLSYHGNNHYNSVVDEKDCPPLADAQVCCNDSTPSADATHDLQLFQAMNGFKTRGQWITPAVHRAAKSEPLPVTTPTAVGSSAPGPPQSQPPPPPPSPNGQNLPVVVSVGSLKCSPVRSAPTAAISISVNAHRDIPIESGSSWCESSSQPDPPRRATTSICDSSLSLPISTAAAAVVDSVTALASAAYRPRGAAVPVTPGDDDLEAALALSLAEFNKTKTTAQSQSQSHQSETHTQQPPQSQPTKPN